MYDFWYTLGTAVMEPKLLDQIDKAKPVFTRVAMRVVMEGSSPGHLAQVEENKETAGLLESASTNRVRAAIATYLIKKEGAPAISIHTAGKMIQMAVVPSIKFRDLVKTVNDVFKKSKKQTTAKIHEAPLSPGFPALLGCTLVDDALAFKIGAGDPQVFEEFRVSADPKSYERTLLQNFTTGSAQARAQLLADAWPRGCDGEQHEFWVGSNERAVMH